MRKDYFSFSDRVLVTARRKNVECRMRETRGRECTSRIIDVDARGTCVYLYSGGTERCARSRSPRTASRSGSRWWTSTSRPSVMRKRSDKQNRWQQWRFIRPDSFLLLVLISARVWQLISWSAVKLSRLYYCACFCPSSSGKGCGLTCAFLIVFRYSV